MKESLNKFEEKVVDGFPKPFKCLLRPISEGNNFSRKYVKKSLEEFLVEYLKEFQKEMLEEFLNS